MLLGDSFSEVIEACWANDGAIYLGSAALIEFSHLKFCTESDEPWMPLFAAFQYFLEISKHDRRMVKLCCLTAQNRLTLAEHNEEPEEVLCKLRSDRDVTKSYKLLDGTIEEMKKIIFCLHIGSVQTFGFRYIHLDLLCFSAVW